MAKEKLLPMGTNSLFIFRSNLAGQNSLQATIEQSPVPKMIIIPRTGSAAPIGSVTMTARKKG